jgi:hypothetical protein
MIEFAQWNMRRELSALWQECFGDPKRIPDFFLNNVFSPRDCLVYRSGGELAAAVYLLPAQILSGGKAVRAHYIFAAATARRFRSRGYMSSLLAYAAIAGAERGDCFSAVLPADDGLCRFYAAAGYGDFFQVRFTDLTAGRLNSMAQPAGLQYRVLPDLAALNRLRTDCLAHNAGSMLWDDRMFRLAVSMSRVYGDRLVCAGAGGGHAYALCRVEEDSCDVLEAFASEKTFPALAAAILREAPAQRYRFRLPVGGRLLSGEGESVRFGMLKAVGGRLLPDIGPEHPYLGLAMD